MLYLKRNKQVIRMKSIFVSFLFLIMVVNAHAQISFGVVAFPQITQLSNAKSAITNNRLSYAGGGGINVTYDFSKKFGIQVGALYSAQNQKMISNYTLGGVSHSHDSRKRFDYFKLPVLLRITRQIGVLDFVVFAGPQFSYLIKYDGGMVVYTKDQYFDLPVTPNGNQYYNKYTVDAVAGLGFELPLSKYLKLTSGLKIDCNVSNAQNSSATFGSRKVSDINGTGALARNITYALMVGVNFKLKDPNDLVAPSNKFRSKSYGRKRRRN